MSDSQLAHRPQSVKDYLAMPTYKDRFAEVLKGRAPQFMASIVAVSQLPGLKDCEPRSIIGAAMTAATLDLAVNPTLGQAYVVAYGGSEGKLAQFQIGYKGLIQLALRSGQYKRLNAGPVSAGAFKGFDVVGEPILDFTQMDPDAEVVGYFCAFETLNGFQKITYWTHKQVDKHAARFSKAYQKGWSSPWKSDFDAMATKTVIKAALTKWGIMSIELQKAAVHDQGVQEDLDAPVKYVDQLAPEDVPGEPLQPDPAATKGAAGAVNAARDVTPAEPKTETASTPAAATPAAGETRATPKPRSSRNAKAEVVVPASEQAAAPTTATSSSGGSATVANETRTAAPTTPPAPEARVFLKDAERITTEITVKSIDTGQSKVGDKLVASVQATVEGGFNGVIRHSGGATQTAPGVITPNPPWVVGARLRVELLGAMSKAATGPNVGKILAWVQGIAKIEESQADEAPPAE